MSILSGGVHSPFQGYKTDPELKDTYSIKNAADMAGYYNDLFLMRWPRDPIMARLTSFIPVLDL